MTAVELIPVHDGIEFSEQERFRYRRPNVPRLIFDLALPWLQVVIGCAIFIAYPSFWTWLVAAFVIAGAQHGLALIAHEASHFLVWPQSKRVNDFIGTYLFAAPTVLPFNVYRQRHVIHHRLVSQAGDTKDVYLRDWSGWGFLLEVVKTLVGWEYLTKVRGAMETGKSGDYDKFAANLRRDQIGIIGVNAIIFVVFTLFDPLHYGVPTYYFILWLWPLLTLSFLFAKIRALVEHQPPRSTTYEGETPYYMNTPGPMLRSVRANWFERLFLSKINFHYHAEHHLWPWISYQHLPEVSERIWQGRDRNQPLALDDNLVYFDRDYSATVREIIRGK